VEHTSSEQSKADARNAASVSCAISLIAIRAGKVVQRYERRMKVRFGWFGWCSMRNGKIVTTTQSRHRLRRRKFASSSAMCGACLLHRLPDKRDVFSSFCDSSSTGTSPENLKTGRPSSRRAYCVRRRSSGHSLNLSTLASGIRCATDIGRSHSRDEAKCHIAPQSLEVTIHSSRD